MTKKFTFIESQRRRRSDVMRPRIGSPPMLKLSSSPSVQPSRSAMPCSTESSSAAGSSQRPAAIALCAGNSSMYERLNSRSISRRARSSA